MSPRSELIRLAYQNPELRVEILPALKSAGWDMNVLDKLWKSYRKEHPGSKSPPQSLKDKAKALSKGAEFRSSQAESATSSNPTDPASNGVAARAHGLAAYEHGEAAKAHESSGNSDKAQYHREKAQGHKNKQREHDMKVVPKNASLRSRTIRLAYENPPLRPHLLPLLRVARSQGEILEGLWQSYKKEHPESKEPPQSLRDRAKELSEDYGKFSLPPKPSEKSKETEKKPKKKPSDATPVKDILTDLSEIGGHVKRLLGKAPDSVKKFLTDADHRDKVLFDAANKAAEAYQKAPLKLYEAAKKEVGEFQTAAEATGKLLADPNVKGFKDLSSHEKKALYAMGAYASSMALGAMTGGAGAAAGAFAQGFAKHVGAKAVHHAVDDLATHHEVGETLMESVHHLMEHTENLSGMFHVGADSGKGDSKGDLGKVMSAAIMTGVLKSMKKGISDKDVKKILSDENEAEESKSKK